MAVQLKLMMLKFHLQQKIIVLLKVVQLKLLKSIQPTTQISYQIPNDGFVNLTVYNSLGQEVAVLVNRYQSIGRYTVQLNASNLSSSIYL